jgi:hypothetical protein
VRKGGEHEKRVHITLMIERGPEEGKGNTHGEMDMGRIG